MILIIAETDKFVLPTKYLLTVIDIFSKYAWAIPLKNKTGESVTDAFNKIVSEGRIPQKLWVDEGKEFYNKTFQSFSCNQNISSHLCCSKLNIFRSIWDTLFSKIYNVKFDKNHFWYQTLVIYMKVLFLTNFGKNLGQPSRKLPE